MIRDYKITDCDAVMSIWLDTTTTAHPFIPSSYWARNFLLVKKQVLPQSTTYVYEENGEILGFISVLESEYIGALFVTGEKQGKGIGKALLNYCKENYDQLNLHVYSENKKSVAFYENNDFIIDETKINKDTQKEEYVMSWISDNLIDLLTSIQY